MDVLVDQIIEEVTLYLNEKGFRKSAKSYYSQRLSPFARTNYIALYFRKKESYIEVSGVCGIKYGAVNKLDKKIVVDFLNPYPVIAGTIGAFKDSEEQYFRLYVEKDANPEQIANNIIENIKAGAENLFENIYPTIESIVDDLKNKNDRYYQFVNPTCRDCVRYAALIYLSENKANALKWFIQNALEDTHKQKYLNLMEEHWK